MTIQKALEMLTYEGLIYSEQGRGTFIKSNVSALSQLDATVNQYVGTTKLFAGKATVKSDILKNELRLPDAEEQEKLQLAKTEAVYDVVRLRFLNEVPYSIEHSIMPAKILGELTDAVLKKSIYEYLEQTLHLNLKQIMFMYYHMQNMQERRLKSHIVQPAILNSYTSIICYNQVIWSQI